MRVQRSLLAIQFCDVWNTMSDCEGHNAGLLISPLHAIQKSDKSVMGRRKLLRCSEIMHDRLLKEHTSGMV